MSKFDADGCLPSPKKMEDLRKKLEFEAWKRCNEQSQVVYDECMRFSSVEKKEWKCAVEKHQDHIFCMHHEKDMIKLTLQNVKQELAVHVTDVGAAGNSTANPSVSSNLRN